MEKVSGQRRPGVLVVEDNVDAANLLAKVLQIYGYNANAVYRGDAAVQAAEKFRPDCVLCDIGLPGLSGFEVARRFRAHPTLFRTPLVALTAYAETPESKAAGFDCHLVKPADSSSLVQVIEGMIAGVKTQWF